MIYIALKLYKGGGHAAVEFRQYKYVLKVAEEKSFSLAAKKLYISQPSLSQLIIKLEEKIGFPLFDRSASPLL